MQEAAGRKAPEEDKVTINEAAGLEAPEAGLCVMYERAGRKARKVGIFTVLSGRASKQEVQAGVWWGSRITDEKARRNAPEKGSGVVDVRVGREAQEEMRFALGWCPRRKVHARLW